jgi:uncharacterized protein (DUF58 family)
MKKNMGTIDRLIRTLVAVVIGFLLLLGKISGFLAVVFGIFAVVLLLTSAIGWCPLYSPLGISTKREKMP